jgi:hypothetical protein
MGICESLERYYPASWDTPGILGPECRMLTNAALRSMRAATKVFEKLRALKLGIEAIDHFGDPAATELLIEHAIVIEELDIDMVHSVAACAFHEGYEARAKRRHAEALKAKPEPYRLRGSTVATLDWIVRQRNETLLRKFLAGRSRHELAAIHAHLAKSQKVAA